MPIKLILFDFEGTVAYYDKKANPIDASKIVRKYYKDIYYQQWENARRYALFIDFPKGNINSWEDFMRKTFENLDINPDEEAVKELAEYYRNNMIFKFFDDLKEIRKLPVKKVIVTTTPIFYFSYLDMNIFDMIITGKESGISKPHPNCFLKALEKFDIKEEETMIVGDDINCDLIIPKELGMKTVLIDRNNKIQGANGHIIIRNMSELKDYI